MTTPKPDDYIVRRTKDAWPNARYKITGGPPLIRGDMFNPQTPWVSWSRTLWGAKRRIRSRRALLARVDRIVHREAA